MYGACNDNNNNNNAISNGAYGGTTPVGAPMGDYDDAETRIPRPSAAALAGRFDVTNPENHVTRTFLVEVHFTMASAAENPNAVTWHLSEKAKQVFGRTPIGADAANAEPAGDMSRAVVLSVAIGASSSTAPVALAVDIAGVPGQSYYGSGTKAALIMPPEHVTTRETPRQIYKADDVVASLCGSDYAHLDEAAVRSEIMRNPTDEEYSYVPVNSAIVSVVRRNGPYLGFDIDSYAPFDGKYHKLPNELIDACCNALNKGVFERMPYCNLDEWAVRLRRADCLPWNCSVNVAEFAANDAVLNEMMTTTQRVWLEIEMTYVLCDASVTKTGGGGDGSAMASG